MSGIVLLAINALGAAQGTLLVSLTEVSPVVGSAIVRNQFPQSTSVAWMSPGEVAPSEPDALLPDAGNWRSLVALTHPNNAEALAHPAALSSQSPRGGQAFPVVERTVKDQQRHQEPSNQLVAPASSIDARQVTSTPVSRSQPSLRPASGGQLFLQRWAALKAGMTYTRLPQDSFAESWQGQTYTASYQQWLGLLAMEADAMSRGQGQNRLAILLGDSLSQWIPSDGLASDQLWLNQSISGDTTSGILARLHLFAHTQPSVIYLMAGINDLRQGRSDLTILRNTRQILRQLKAQHPQARIVVKSILPTRYDALPAQRIRHLNGQLAAIAQQEGAIYLDLASLFSNQTGILRRDLTTDGIHLSPKGYELWQWMLSQDALNVAGQTITVGSP